MEFHKNINVMSKQQTKQKDKPKPTTDEKIDRTFKSLVKLVQSTAVAEGKSDDFKKLAKIVSSAVQAKEKGKPSLADGRLGDLANGFSRLANPSEKDVEKLAKALLRRMLDPFTAEEKAPEE